MPSWPGAWPFERRSIALPISCCRANCLLYAIIHTPDVTWVSWCLNGFTEVLPVLNGTAFCYVLSSISSSPQGIKVFSHSYMICNQLELYALPRWGEAAQQSMRQTNHCSCVFICHMRRQQPCRCYHASVPTSVEHLWCCMQSTASRSILRYCSVLCGSDVQVVSTRGLMHFGLFR